MSNVRSHTSTTMVKFFFLLTGTLVISAPAVAEPLCRENGQLSGVALSQCLEKELRATDGLLAEKLKLLIARAKSADVGFSRQDLAAARREEVVAAILASQKAWRAEVQSECEVLLVASYGGGTGAGNAALSCRIDRASERISRLSKLDAFSWLWQ